MTGPLGEGQDKTRWWKTVSTDGDFTTASRAFVQVPETAVVFSLDQAEEVHFSLQAVVHMGACKVGLRVDGLDQNYLDVMAIPEFAGRTGLYPVSLGCMKLMLPGAHSASMVICAGIRKRWEGPKEWSPRKSAAGTARLSRSPEMPVVVMAEVLP